MPLAFIIPLAVFMAGGMVIITVVIAGMAYRDGYEDALLDHGIIAVAETAEAAVAHERFTAAAGWSREWAERNALDAGGYPYSAN